METNFDLFLYHTHPVTDGAQCKKTPIELKQRPPPAGHHTSSALITKTLLQTYFAEQQSPRQGLRFRQVRRNWSDVKCFSCGKTGHSSTRCPTLDVTFPFILPGWKADKTSTGYLMISPKMGGKRRLIRREGFASRISKNARPHDPGGDD